MRLLIGILFLTLISSRCSVQYTTNGTDTGDAESVTVKIFNVKAPLAPPSLGQIFTEDLQEILLSQTKLDVVNNSTDLVFDGSITNYTITPVGIQAGDVAAQNRLTITVLVNYINKLDPKKGFERSFSRFADFPSSQDINSVQDGLIEEIHEQITQDIINASLSNW